MKQALIIVDAQKDFWDKNWSLYVKDAEGIIIPINKLIEEVRNNAWIIVASRDWHPDNHCSFKWENAWPAHCVENSWWAEYMDWLNAWEIQYEVKKWFRADKDSYSAFGWYEFRNWYPLDNLHNLLADNEVSEIKIVWLATDYCVKDTVLSAIQEYKYKVQVITNCIRAVNINPEDEERAIDAMRKAWAIII
jgi:nicotinamidase-related amidase